jgi:hypothetical protein
MEHRLRSRVRLGNGQIIELRNNPKINPKVSPKTTSTMRRLTFSS